MIVGRVIGWILVVMAVAALGHEVILAFETGSYHFIALGEQWFKINPASLNISQAAIQRYVAPWLWEPVITTILLWPTWLVLGIPGIFLTWAFRIRNGRRRR